MAQRPKAISLTSFRGFRTKRETVNSVKFHITPEVAEARSVNYSEISDVRLPSSILIWMGSPSRNFNINAKFLARSPQEASDAFKNISLLKSWCVTNSPLGPITRQNVDTILHGTPSPTDTTAPASGTETQETEKSLSETINISGPLFTDTPEVLLLEGYGEQFRKIPVVITSLNITFPSDTDYIESPQGAWVPILHEISISLKEAREISDRAGAIGGFSLSKFKQGTLEYW